MRRYNVYYHGRAVDFSVTAAYIARYVDAADVQMITIDGREGFPGGTLTRAEVVEMCRPAVTA